MVICFFCLRETDRYEIVRVYVEVLGMEFRVYACPDCASRRGYSTSRRTS